MTTAQLVKDWYVFGFCSGKAPSNSEVNTIIRHNCECDNCGQSIFELDDYPNVQKGEVLCEDCYRSKYMETCDICENYFYKALKPKDQILIISKEAVKEYCMDVKPGFYQVKKWPFHYGNIVSGFDGLFTDAIELIKEVDINSMLNKLFNGNKSTVWANECCHDCVKKYTGQTKITNNFIDKAHGKKRVKFMREIIALGY